ncbi:hypothetical protein LE181_10950 [Streptomyces sp. SCA3-4]|uniref:terpene synthase family protein n=1 Tax=Streptomyces sichuanensis TaxID=2871810 RepID=UPI001CE2BCC6|nr:hypothetical protein [Streptomyces sichuanensis]MCA6092679.1 hypothetical protein [Streptomyces sichuanensis]
MASTQMLHPFAAGVSPDVERARIHGLQWARDTGMTGSDRAVEYYRSVRLAEFGAMFYPYAEGEDIELASDAMTFYFLFDDQFDGEVGKSPRNVARVIDDLAGIIAGRHRRQEGAATSYPVYRAFLDLWRRMCEGMDADWCARSAQNWLDYLYGHVAEAVDRENGNTLTFDEYLVRRRATIGAYSSMDLIERLGHFTVPRCAFESTHVRTMRLLCCEFMLGCNDIHSFEKEKAHGERNNLVIDLARQYALTDAQALERARSWVRYRADAFVRCEARIPELCRALGFSGEETQAVDQYVLALEYAMSGYNDWGNTTPRYTGDPSPGAALAYLEDLAPVPAHS